MSENNKTLRLADALEDDLEDYAGLSLPRLCQGIADAAAAELRRLVAQRDALLEALKLARPYISTYTLDGYHAEVKADAAIKAVEGEKT